MKYLFNLLLCCSILLLVSCNDDDAEADRTAPSIEILGPTDGFSAGPGDELVIFVSATDDVEMGSVMIELGDIYSNTTQGNTSTISVNETVTIADDQAPGTYTMTVTARDAANNSTTETIDIIIAEAMVFCNPVAACQVDGEITIMVETPASTPADAVVHVAGSFQGWDSSTTPLTKVDGVENCFCGSFAFAGGEEFKFTRGGADFADVEKTADCEELDNRTYTAGDEIDGILRFVVEEWRDICE